MSIMRACQIAGLSRATYYKRPALASERDAEVIDALNAIVTRHGRWGFWKCFARLRLDGRCWTKKRVHRVYCEIDLNMPRRCRKRLPDRPRQPLELANASNCCWALDCMHDTLYCGRRFRTLNVIDEANRECLAIEIGTSIPSARLIRVLNRLIDCYCHTAGQWAGTGLANVHRMGSGQKHRHPIYPARKAKPECFYRTL